jgi:carbonic anhydrase/acetyltransferase-like protein (isoleucine patch superfamily)
MKLSHTRFAQDAGGAEVCILFRFPLSGRKPKTSQPAGTIIGREAVPKSVIWCLSLLVIHRIRKHFAGGRFIMMIKHRGVEPRMDQSVFVAPTAVICGNVNVGPQTRVMYGAVIDSEASAVKIGTCCIVCEHAVIRATKTADTDHRVRIGDHVFISPHATLLGCRVASQAYIATCATVLQGAKVGRGAVVAVGALVHAGTIIPEGFFLAPNTVAIGDPPKIYGPEDKDAVVDAIKSIAFTKIAFGVKPHLKDRVATMIRATEIRSKEFESHFDDMIL